MPMETSDRINEIYYGKVLSAKSQAQAQARVAWICQHVVGTAVLDIGCSQGIISILLARAGKEVTAIDIDEESIDYARKELALEREEIRERVTLIHGDALQCSFNENSYDTVVMGQLIEHVGNPSAFLDLARRVCRPEGRVIITTPFGLLDHPDHKHTFYLYQFASLISPFFTAKELDIVGKRICFSGEPSKTSAIVTTDSIQAISEEWHRKIHQLSEQEFERVERENHELLVARAATIKKQQGNIEEFQGKIAKLQGVIVKLQNSHSEQIRELKASARFRIGDALVSAVRSPRGAIAFPMRLWLIYSGYRSKGKPHFQLRTSKTSESCDTPQKTVQIGRSKAPMIRKASPIQEARVLFMPTNGAGLGHVTRLLAIARRLKNDTRICECVFLTNSEALNLFRQEGFVAYHFPSPQRLKDKLTAREWNSCFQKLLEMTLINHDINVFVFDGVIPYSAITKTIQPMKNVRKIWVRRGMLKEGLEERLCDAEKFFDLQIIPGELGQKNAPKDSVRSITVPPIVFLERRELLPREEVIKTLGLDPRKKTVFIQLGAGNINEIEAQIEIIVDTIFQFDGVQVVLANSVIAQTRFSGFENIKIIRDYPLSRYYLGFDIAVSAAGYNTFSELIYFGVPSIFVPNLETVSDDQLARAMISENTGTGLVLHPFSISRMKDYLEILLDDARNGEFRRRCLEECSQNGSEAAARIITEFLFGASQMPATLNSRSTTPIGG
jgi:2-polyprenyl-3-methyl-5-hydroxy-6-metoxy-1,4-benzoquinol methylase/UDP:flavonoid glycosyltransferase YjiC (YdhE family)